MFIIRVLMIDNRWNRPLQAIKSLRLSAYSRKSLEKNLVSKELNAKIACIFCWHFFHMTKARQWRWHLNFLKSTLRLCMTDLTEVLRRCTTLPDPLLAGKNLWEEKMGAGRLRHYCRAFVMVMKKCQQKYELFWELKEAILWPSNTNLLAS
jgi:hypothetical protein